MGAFSGTAADRASGRPRPARGASFAVFLALLLAGCGRGSKDAEPLAIGWGTTRLVAPRTADGRVDYAAALNAAGAPPPQENAAIPLLRILGTDALHGDRAAVLAMLRAPADLPAAGSFVPRPQDLPGFLEFGDLDAQEQAAASAWLDASRSSLDALVEATRLPRLWWPVVEGAPVVVLEHALPVDSFQALQHALLLRAQRRTAQGRLGEAWEDLSALLRLYGLADQSSGIVARIVAYGVLREALDLLAKTLEGGAFDAALCEQALRALLRLPTPRDLSGDFDGFERFAVLSGWTRETVRAVEAASGRVARHPAYAGLNAGLARFNLALDEVVPLLRSLTPESLRGVRAQMDARTVRLKEWTRGLKSGEGLAIAVAEQLASGGRHTGALAGEVLADALLPVVPFTLEAVLRGLEQRRVVALALALRLHRLRTGAFPERLEDLVPGELDALPASASGPSVPYERTDEGCRVGSGGDAVDLRR